MTISTNNTDHFEGLNPLEHIHKKRAEEIHGAFLSPPWSSFFDATVAITLLLFILVLISNQVNFAIDWRILTVISSALTLACAGRFGWIGYRRLERLHRLVQQERHEIEHHRPQEREELIALYGAKGMSGQLLDQVVDFLMADDERLLKVMLEEEMGLVLACEPHPLQYAFSGFLGALFASCLFIILFSATPLLSLFWAPIAIGISGGLVAYMEQNDILSGVLWALGIMGLATGTTLLLIHMILQ